MAAWDQSLHLNRLGIASRRCPTDLPIGPPTCLPRDNHRPVDLPSCVPPSLPIRGMGRIRPKTASDHSPSGWARTRWYRNINRLCIDYAFRPRLSSRLTLGGLAFPRNPWAFGGGVSHPSLATHASIRTRPRSTTVSTAASLRDRRSPTTPHCCEVRSFGSGL